MQVNNPPRVAPVKGHVIVYVLVAVWAVAFAWSIFGSLGIEGPRNIDTGFRRLDVLFRGQLIAFGIAIVAGASGFLMEGCGFRQKLIGLLPLLITVLIVAFIALFAFFHDPVPPPDASAPTRPTVPAADAQDGG